MWQLLRTNRDLRWVFLAQVVSFLGDWFVFVALAGFVDDNTDSELLVSLVLVSFALPSFLVSPLAGPVVDRVDRRMLLVVVSGAQALAASGLLLLAEDRIWVAFVFQGMVAGLAAFVKPAIDAAVPNLARTPEELRTANALLGSTWGVMLAVGAGLGGLFSQAFGRRAAIVADIVTFVVAGLLILLVRRPMQQRREPAEHHSVVHPMADMREAVNLARHDRVILALMSSKATFAIGAGVVSQLAVLASDVHGSGDRGRGLLLAARGVGSGLGPFLAARWARGSLRRILNLCGWAAILFACAYLGAAWAPTLVLTAALVTVAHLGGGAQWTLSTYGLQLRVPDALLGRVMAGDFAIVTLVLSLTSVGAGLVSTWRGVQPAITVFAVAAALAGTAYLFLTRRLRHTDTV
ncbi:MAG: MFS transporter [Acidimicrobiia bacterium]|nr:MFS transporter [Acidimicrobiia bacterium]